MAGHSKWANIKHRKGSQDAKRSKIFAKISREITIASLKGSDPSSNSSLRLALSKARANSMPKKNIETAINKATGQKEGVNFKEYIYAGNVFGVSFLIFFLADNANRIASTVQAYFNKIGGSLSSVSSVNHIFKRQGILAWPKTINDNEDAIMLLSLESGAEDFEIVSDVFYVYTNPSQFHDVKDKLEKNNITNFTTAEITYVPVEEVVLPHDKALKIVEFIEKLEDDDDVQNVFHNLDPSSLEENAKNVK